MALTDTRSDSTTSGSATTDNVMASPATLEGWLGTVDHKPVGRMFITGGAIGLLMSFVVALIASYESADGLGFQIARDLDEFTQVWSVSRDLMFFGGIVPLFVGIGLYIVPLQIGASSLAFARGASGAFWTWLLGSGLLIVAYLYNGGPGGGRSDFVILWAAALAMVLGGLIWALVVLASTILGARTVGMTMDRVPMTTWGYFLFALIGIVSLPVLIAELLLAYLRVEYLHLSVEASESLVAIVNGAAFAPSVYWLALPALGIGADIISSHTGVVNKFQRPTMAAITLFALLTFGPDLVAMGSVRTLDLGTGLRTLGLLSAVVAAFAVLAINGDCLRRGVVKPRPALLGALLSGLLLLAATVVSLLGVVEPMMRYADNVAPDSIDMTNSLVLNGTTFHEAIRALIVGSALLAAIAGLYHWSVKIWGRNLPAPMGVLSIALAAAGSGLWAFGELAAGLADQPFYPELIDTDGSLFAFGMLSTAGVAAMLGSGAILVAALASMISTGKVVGSGPELWSGPTLEWAAASPPPLGNFPAPPIVTSAAPLNDGELAYDGLGSGTNKTQDTVEGEEA